MGLIAITDIRVYAYHGCLPQETAIGSDYRVNVKVRADLAKSAASDRLADTADYVQINGIVKEEMGVPSKLLEHVAQRILDRILLELSLIDEAEVQVSKMNPPIGGDVERVSVVLSKKRNR